ncbi:hypothetical protein C4561_00740 [candidate division WWE3 bacterium]|uniref:Uncharacterized protein n=1 Tax=candidate division WWE3 bacterium TaxID=2053526 RepID=A0A3A4ZMA9_UNCKA|nr:MAG: hypothetical protein C4561_00740 [candidate division WWE3 bacterium]
MDAVQIFSALLGKDPLEIVGMMAVDSDAHQINDLQSYGFPNMLDEQSDHVGMYFYRIYAVKLDVRVIWMEVIIYNPSKDDGTCSGFTLGARISISDGYYNQPNWRFFGKAEAKRKNGEYKLVGSTFLAYAGIGLGNTYFYDAEHSRIEPEPLREYLEKVRHARIES